ncbi:MAG: DUF4334 domain-containing protein [Pseudomonadota bacterium]
MSDHIPRLTEQEAVARFDAAEPATCEDLIGSWHGSEIDTGHRMSGVLDATYWQGKFFRTRDEVFPLIHDVPLFGEVRLNPGLLPVGLIAALPLRDHVLPVLVTMLAPLLHTRAPRARLRDVSFRGRTGAAMIYDGLPMIDHFVKYDQNQMLGWMEMRGEERPYFFLLTRDVNGS